MIADKQPVAEATPMTDMSEAEELLRDALEMLNSAHVSTDLVWPRSDLILKIDDYLARPADGVVVPSGYTLVKTATLKWLLGETENENGVWFERPVGAGAFWWRTDLRKAMLSAAPSVKGCGE
jgi:hypothetical protein